MEKFLFPNITREEKNVLFKICCHVRKQVLESYTVTFWKAATRETEIEKSFQESPAGRGKNRYIGGWCILGKLLKIKRSNIKKNLYKNACKKYIQSLSIELDLLQHLCEAEGVVFEKLNSKSLCMKQQENRTWGRGWQTYQMRHITSSQTWIRQSEIWKRLKVFVCIVKNSFHFFQDELFSNKTLRQSFGNIFPPTSEKDTLDKSLKEILSKYGLMSLSQIRRNYLEEMKIMKTEAQRKQIKIKKSRTGKDVFYLKVI